MTWILKGLVGRAEDHLEEFRDRQGKGIKQGVGRGEDAGQGPG